MQTGFGRTHFKLEKQGITWASLKLASIGFTPLGKSFDVQETPSKHF